MLCSHIAKKTPDRQELRGKRENGFYAFAFGDFAVTVCFSDFAIIKNRYEQEKRKFVWFNKRGHPAGG